MNTRTGRLDAFRAVSASFGARSYVDRIAEEAETAADAAEQVHRKVARHGKATRKVAQGGGR